MNCETCYEFMKLVVLIFIFISCVHRNNAAAGQHVQQDMYLFLWHSQTGQEEQNRLGKKLLAKNEGLMHIFEFISSTHLQNENGNEANKAYEIRSFFRLPTTPPVSK